MHSVVSGKTPVWNTVESESVLLVYSECSHSGIVPVIRYEYGLIVSCLFRYCSSLHSLWGCRFEDASLHPVLIVSLNWILKYF